MTDHDDRAPAGGVSGEVPGVVVPVDGWPGSDRALLPGRTLARRLGVPLVLVSAVEDPHEVAGRRIELETRAALLEVQSRVEVTVDPHVIDTLAAHELAGELVVMATSGSIGLHDGYLGSMAEKLLRRNRRPVALVGRCVDPGRAFDVDRVLVALDGSRRAEVAVDVGRWWSERLGLPLWFVQVVAPDRSGDTEEQGRYLHGVAASVGAGARWELLRAKKVANALVDTAGERGLLVLATHGRSGLARIALGSVAVHVTKRAHQPVVVVAAPDLQDQE